MANFLRVLFCVSMAYAYGTLVEEEVNALLDDSCEGECSLTCFRCSPNRFQLGFIPFHSIQYTIPLHTFSKE